MTLCVVALLAVVFLARLGFAGTEGWFAWEPEEDFRPSVIDMSDWLDAPAGKHGAVQMRDGGFEFEDGTRVKFWGTNLCWDDVAPAREVADRWARFAAKYGVNCIRFHKFTRPGDAGLALGERDSTTMDPEKLDRMDYFAGQLRERGVYYGWSPIFRHRMQPGDSDHLLAYQELAAWHEENGWGDIGLVNFARDLQDIHTEMMVELLNHRNPYTDLRYAEDPALAFVELQNEDDIFWPATEKAVEACPTYRALLCTMFCHWLRSRYGTSQGLERAWGKEALRGESLEGSDICPSPAYHHYTEENLAEHPEQRRRLLDSARFLYEVQNQWYSRLGRAVRDTGYRGPLVGSCWQAGHGIPHYLNLHSDYRTGIIDRHNYYGRGAGRHRMATGPVDNQRMVDRPGSALLTVGMQQVADRPFAFSEWICVLPDEWGAETAPLIAAYGMGLQDWDASYEFCSRTTDHLWWETLSAGGNVYNVDSPLHLGQYPVLARMVLRGDVRPGEPVAVRRVCPPALLEGELELEERLEQDGDVKVFRGDTPSEALAAGRVLIEFTEEPAEHERADLDTFWDRAQEVVRANTGQLAWHYGERAYVTVDTPATQGVVGAAGGEVVELADVIVEMESPFAALLLTSVEPEADIADGPVLLSAVARARNTGMRYDDEHAELLEVGAAPLLLEGVEATITLKGCSRCRVTALDHCGRRTETEVPVAVDGDRAVFHVGPEYATPYYELVY